MKDLKNIYFVEYVEEDGTINADHWSQAALEDAIKDGIKINYIALAYHIQVALGLIDED